MLHFILDLDGGLINFFRVAVLVATALALYASVKVDYPPKHNTASLLFILGTFSIGAMFGLTFAFDVIGLTTYRRWSAVVAIMTYTADIVLAFTFIRFANHQRHMHEEGKRRYREAALERLSDAELFKLDHSNRPRKPHEPS